MPRYEYKRDHRGIMTESIQDLIRAGEIDDALAEILGYDPETGKQVADVDEDIPTVRTELSAIPDGSEQRPTYDLPVVSSDEKRLAFKNPGSGTESIHVAAIEQSDAAMRDRSTYDWSVCGSGCLRTRTANAMYLSPEELDADYIDRDDEVVGKLCGNCRRGLDSAPLHSD